MIVLRLSVRCTRRRSSPPRASATRPASRRRVTASGVGGGATTSPPSASSAPRASWAAGVLTACGTVPALAALASPAALSGRRPSGRRVLQPHRTACGEFVPHAKGGAVSEMSRIDVKLARAVGAVACGGGGGGDLSQAVRAEFRV
eukprot:4251560-Pleurochrysis_carterae.AAC.5